MNIEDFKGMMDGFDPASLLPDLEPILGKLALLARIAVLIGPVVLLIIGLVYLFAAPKEANYYIGYRCYYGMGSVEAWRFTQGLAGVVFGALGLVMIVAMLLICGSFAEMQTMDLLWRAIYCLAGEAIAALIACLVINIVVMIRYDRKGNERKKKAVRR